MIDFTANKEYVFKPRLYQSVYLMADWTKADE